MTIKKIFKVNSPTGAQVSNYVVIFDTGNKNDVMGINIHTDLDLDEHERPKQYYTYMVSVFPKSIRLLTQENKLLEIIEEELSPEEFEDALLSEYDSEIFKTKT